MEFRSLTRNQGSVPHGGVSSIFRLYTIYKSTLHNVFYKHQKVPESFINELFLV